MKYTNNKTGKSVDIDETNDALRQQWEAQGYVRDAGYESDPRVTNYEGSVTGNGQLTPAWKPMPKNIPVVPGASYDTPPQMRPESNIGGMPDSAFLNQFKAPPPVPPTAAPTASPSPAPAPTAAPTAAPAKPTQAPTAAPTAQPPVPTQAPLSNRPSTPVPMDEPVPTPNMETPIPTNFDLRPKMGFPDIPTPGPQGEIAPVDMEALRMDEPYTPDTSAMQNFGVKSQEAPNTETLDKKATQGADLKAMAAQPPTPQSLDLELPGMPGLKPGQETDLPGAPKAEKIPPMPTPLAKGMPAPASPAPAPVAKGMPAPASSEQWKPDTSMFKNFGLGENNDVANAPEMGNIPVPAPSGGTGNAPEQPTGPERQGIQSQGTLPPVDVRDTELPLGATDIQDPSVKGKKSQEQISGNILNPEDELGMRDAQQYGKNQGRGGVDELLSRLNTEDESRFSRAAKLADARGAAFDKYMQGLDKNEQASFISTIVNSLGKILVGGFDLATGPKTASVSQFYKGPEQFDKKAADASEKGRYDAGLQRLNEDEKSIQDTEKNYMDSRMALEELRGKVNGDVFNMASRINDLTKKAYQQGHDVDYITKGMLGVLAQGHNYEMQMEELKGFYRLAEATINGDQAAIRAAMNSKAMVDAAKWQKTNNVEDKKVTTRNIDLNQPAFVNAKNAASAATDILGHPSFKNVTESQLVKQVSDVDNAFKAYAANKNPQTLDGYLRALQTWKAATYAALNEGNSGYTIFRGQDNATKKKSLDNLSNILDFYIQGIRRDSNGSQHPLLTKGYAGLQDISQFVNDEQTKLLRTGKSDFFALPEAHTVGNTVTEGTKVDFKGPSPNGPAQQQPSPTPAPATATPGATPSAKPTLPTKPATPAPTPKPTATPKSKGFIGDANDFLKGFSTPLPTIKELRDKLAAGTITAQEKQKLIELMKQK